VSEAPQLQARSVTDIIDAAFSLYRRNFALFAGVVAVLGVPQTLITMLVAAVTPHPAPILPAGSGPSSRYFTEYLSTAATSSAASGADGLIGVLFGAIITLALARAIAARYLGEPVTVLGAYRSLGFRPVGRLILAGIFAVVAGGLALAILIGVGILVIVVLNQVALAAAVIFGIVYFLALFALIIYVSISVVFLPQVIALAGGGPVRSFPRSWLLIRGYWWRVFGCVLLLSLITSILTGIVGTILIFAIAFGSPVLAAAISGVVGILLQPIQLTGMTLLYFDQRIRKEGFDLELALAANPV